jgi:NAD(P)-dependent dehydrogenase (short-subunit alcohol dehydrogenase family)
MKKNILMIGGSHGIGLSMARQMRNENNMFIASRSKNELQNLDVVYIPFDAISDTLDTGLLPEKLHGFAYCPGTINLKPFKMMGIETFREDMELNFFSMVRIVKEVLPRMADQSSMVFFSTVAVGMGMPYHTSIAAAKGAIEGFARSLAAEYAPKVRVNVIAPSLVDTPLSTRLLDNDKKRKAMSARHPLQRVGTPEDIAHMGTFLLSDQSAWLTGQIIGIDGGISALNIQ